MKVLRSRKIIRDSEGLEVGSCVSMLQRSVFLIAARVAAGRVDCSSVEGSSSGPSVLAR